MKLYLLKMSFFINGILQFVELGGLGYSSKDKAFNAIKMHQKIHLKFDYKQSVSDLVLEKVYNKDIYQIKYEIKEIVKAID